MVDSGIKILIIILFVLFIGCEKEDQNMFSDANYPTKYCLINDQEKQQLEFLLPTDNFSNLAIDTLGFIHYNEFSDTEPSFFEGTINSPDSVIKIAKKFLIDHSGLTGVEDTSLLKVENISGYWAGYGKYIQNSDEDRNRWYIKFHEQTWNGCIVWETGIGVYICPRGVYKIYNNWFPEIYTPTNGILSYEDAKVSLYGKTFAYSDWVGEKTITLYANSFYDDDTGEKIYFPYHHENCIEIRLCWKISSKSLWNFYVDVMTGELIHKEQTIIF